MNFKEGLPIYVQIAERLCDEVLAGHYEADGRVPGLREYSALLEVNVNTTVKAFEHLAQRGIVYTRRGMGYFVSPDACGIITEQRRRSFYEHDVPEFCRKMRQLGISAEQLPDIVSRYGAQNTPPESVS